VTGTIKKNIQTTTIYIFCVVSVLTVPKYIYIRLNKTIFDHCRVPCLLVGCFYTVKDKLTGKAAVDVPHDATLHKVNVLRWDRGFAQKGFAQNGFAQNNCFGLNWTCSERTCSERICSERTCSERICSERIYSEWICSEWNCSEWTCSE
jgi:hypothetical protein